MKSNFYSILCLLLLFFSCVKQERTTFEGRWLGMSFELDKDFHVPNNVLAEIKPDSTYTYRFLGSDRSVEGKWSVKSDTLHLEGLTKIAMNTIELKGDRMIWKTANPYHFEVPQSAEFKAAPEALKTLLSAHDWETDEEVWSLSEDMTLQCLDKQTNQYTTFCWDTDRYEDLTFLIRKGSVHRCDNTRDFTAQILDVNDKQLRLSVISPDKTQLLTFNAVEKGESKTSEQAFQLCNQYLYLNYPHHRYYYQGTKYTGGMYKVRKIFNKQYQPVTEGVNSGVVRIRFIVNCAGETGRFEMLELDLDYKPQKLNPKITSQLMNITQSLDEWIPGERNEQTIDTFKFISFRLKDGEIQEIFP